MTWKSKVLILLLLITTIPSPLMIPATATIEHVGTPRLDEILYGMIVNEDARVDGLLAGVVDMIPGPYRKHNIDEVQAAGYNLTFNPGFYEGVLIFNCRDYWPPEVVGGPNGRAPGDTVKPLNDSAFRVATQYIWGMNDKNALILSFYGGPWKFGVQSIVPPAQTPWHDPAKTMPDTNFTSAWAILQAAGYYVNVSDQRLCNPDGTQVRDIEIACPFGAINLDHIAAEFVRSMNDFTAFIGAVNGPRFTLVPREFVMLIQELLYYHDFDIACIDLFMGGPFPDWLYDLFHSSNIGVEGGNIAGVSDPQFDTLLETVKFSLVIDEVRSACYQFQHYFDEVFPCFPVYSGYIIDTFHPNLANFLGVHGYGSDNDWTWKLMHWKGTPLGGSCIRALSGQPTNLNPLYESSHQGWEMMGNALDSFPPTVYFSPYQEGTGMALGLLHIDPTNIGHTMPWIGHDWILTLGSWPEFNITDGMKVTFYLRNDVTWHDGKPFTSYDCAYAWETIKKYKIGRYSEIAKNLVYAEPECPYIVSAYINATSPWILYNLAATANLCPKHIWKIAEEMVENGTWASLKQFNPAATTYKAWTGQDPPAKYPFMKALIGTGPYVWDYYEPSLGVGRVQKYEEYWVNSPVVGCVDAPLRVDPDNSTDYEVLVQNVGSKISGELESATVDVEVCLDGILQSTTTVNIDPFGEVWLGPYNTGRLAYGLHNITVEIYEEAELIHTYVHKIYATIKEDINLNFEVDILDLDIASHAYGSYPGHPRWNPKADIIKDFLIDCLDLNAVNRMFGWKGGPPTVGDIAITKVWPSEVWSKPGEIVDIYVEVENQGPVTEAFRVTTYANITVIGTITVESLASGEKITLTFVWNTTGVQEGNYTISAYATSVPYETDTEDNLFINGTVTVSPIQLGLTIDGSGSISPSGWTIIVSGLATAIREQLPHDGSVELTVIQFSTTARVEINATVINATNYATIANTVGNLTQMAGMTNMADGLWLTWEAMKNSTNFLIAAKQVINMATDGVPNELLSYIPSPTSDPRKDTAWVRDKAAGEGLNELDAEAIGPWPDLNWMRDYVVYPQPGTIAPPYTPGWVDWVANATEFAEAIRKKLERLVYHDIATINVTPSKIVVGQGYSMSINATVENQGGYTETFNVTVYANTSVIQTKTLTLTSGASTTITFTWNTTGFAKGNYTINAYAWPVPGETDTTDNSLSDGWVIVSVVGDITGPVGLPDGVCDIRDIYGLVLRYMRPDRYHPNWDINNDGVIDIKDIYTAVLNYMKPDP